MIQRRYQNDYLMRVFVNKTRENEKSQYKP